MTHDQLGFSSRAIHAGQGPDPTTGAVVPPIHQVSTYKQDGIGGLRGGYEYSRSGNPTRTALEECVAALEGGERGFAFASGLAGEDAVLRALLRPGDHVVVPSDAYGGTYRLFARVVSRGACRTRWPRWPTSTPCGPPSGPRRGWCGWRPPPTPSSGSPTSRRSPRSPTRRVRCSSSTTPSPRPTCRARSRSVPTWSCTRRPSTQAATATSSAGAVVVAPGATTRDGESVAERIGFHQNAMGAVAGPFDAWLVLRGLKTLAVRMERHCDNAEVVVDFLQSHPGVTEVLYPGLPDHPGHDVAARQMRRFGGMVAFRVRGGEDVATKVCAETTLWTLGESLGGVESLIEHPGRMTHASVAGTELEVPGDLVRLSVGIEDVADLVADLRQALDRLA